MQMAQRLASGMFELLSRADTILTDYTRAQRAERRLAARWAGVKPSDARIYTILSHEM